MAIESAVALRRVARTACLVLLAGLLPGIAAKAQLPIKAPAPVSVGSVVPFSHGSTGEWIQIYSQKIDPLYGHVVMLDSAGSVIYDMAPGASTPTVIVGPEPSNKDQSDCSLLESKGSYWNAAVAFDKWDNMYVTDRYGSSVQFCRVPYDASAGTWIFSSADIWKGPTYTNSSGQQAAIPPQDLQSGDDGVTFYVSTSSTNSIFRYTVDQSGNVTNVTPLITGMEAFASQIEVDHAGNLYFVENQGAYPNNVHGIREIAGASTTKTNLQGDGTGSTESALPRIDSGGWNGITGMFVDVQGNLYFGSANNISYGGQADGVFMIPNEGTPASPKLVWADTVMVSPVDGGYPPLVDPRGFLWIATSYNNNWAPTGVNGPTCDSTNLQTQTATCLTSTIVLWKPGALNLGSSAVGGPSAVPITSYAVATGGGSLTLTAKNSFTENQVVTISAKSGDPLFPLNGQSFYVAGTGLTSTSFQLSTSLIASGSGSTSATASVSQTQAIYYMFNQATTPNSFFLASPSNANFKPVANTATPDNPEPTNPVVPCANGTTYPAFTSDMTTSNTYSWCPYYVQLNTTKAGSVEGEVQLLDSSQDVISGSNAYITGIGQGAAISVVSSPTVESVALGLNQPKQVAADLWGNTYVADSALKAIEMYPTGTTSPAAGKVVSTGLSAPTGVATDGVGNLYIGDSGNVYLIPVGLGTASQTKIASGLGTGNLNLAADGQGDVFVADEAGKQVVEIPNPQTALMMQGYPQIKLGSGFSGPSAIATDSTGNVWVADGGNLYEITMPWGGMSKVASGLQSVTGIAVDPSGSVFVAEASGLVWIPYSTSTGALNPNSSILIASGLGSGSAIPWGVAVDGSQNVYAAYGSGTNAGLAQLGIGGTINFNNGGVELNPNVPAESDAQILNLGNQPMTVSDSPTVDVFTGVNAADYTVMAATQNSPACSSTTSISPGGSCYLGLTIQAPVAGSTTASVAVISNAVNATSGVNIALLGNVVQDLRPATTAAITITPTTGTGCSGATYPGCNSIKVVVSAGTYGTPQGTVTLSVSSLNGNLPKQTQTLDSTGTAIFTFSGLLGGTYNVAANYSGFGTAGATQNTCASGNCFAGTAGSTTFTIARATPVITLGTVMTNIQCLNGTTPLPGAPSSTNCGLNSTYVTLWAGNTYVGWTNPVYVSAIVNSPVGTPTGTVTFQQSGQAADPTQGVNGAIALNGNGVSTFTLQNLAKNQYTLAAVYSGDVNYAPLTIPVSTFYVISPSIQITASSGTVSLTPGTPVQVTLTMMPLVGFSSTHVSLECNTSDAPIKLATTNPATTLPQYSECTFNYADPSTGTSSVGSTGATASTIVMTISTNVAVNGGTSASIAKQAPWTLAGLFGLGLVGLITGRRKLYRYMAVICIAMVLSGLFMGMTACTNAGYSTPPPAPNVKTPQGTYNVQIISYDPEALQQTSLTSPMFTLPVSVQ